MLSRRTFLGSAVVAALAARAVHGQERTVKYVRYEFNGRASYGLLEGETIQELRGDLFNGPRPTGAKRKVGAVRLLVPCEPSKLLAVGLNYKSHIGSRTPPAKPEIFIKTPSALLEHGGKIVIPEGTKDVHYEGELVLVIGKKAKKISVAEAPGHIFGVSCGNDVSARDWQKGDLQWWRAKSADTFAALGPCIAVGLDYGKLHLQTRLNGQVKQTQTTADLLFDPATIVSFISQAMTLLPGDVIYTGTPGATSAMKPGDVVEVEIEGIGVLKNTVA